MTDPEGAANNLGPGTYFALARDKFHRLANQPGATAIHNLEIAGRRLELKVAKGPMERALLRGLAHLVAEPAGAPDLSVMAWDAVTTGTEALKPTWSTDDYGPHGLIRGYNDERYHTALQFEPNLFRMIDMSGKEAIYWTPDAGTVPYWERGAPMRPLLHEWLRRLDVLAVHGGAIGDRNGAVLIAGSGGQGKSNSSLACLNHPDLFYASDDFCCVAEEEGEWVVYSLYSTGKIAAGDIFRHPHLAGTASNPDEFEVEKALFYLAEHFPDKILPQMPLKAIILPMLSGEKRTTLKPLSRALVQRTVAMSTIDLSRWMSAFTFQRVANLVRALPCYELSVGEDINEVPLTIRALLDQLR